MKNWKGKAVAVTLLVFVLYVLFNHMNLNPLYPEAAFAYCVLFTVLFAIFTLDKIGRFAVSQAANGAPHVAFVRHPKFRRWPIVVVAVLWGAFFAVSIGSSVLFQVKAFREQMPELQERCV